jgi:hypothetical protein
MIRNTSRGMLIGWVLLSLNYTAQFTKLYLSLRKFYRLTARAFVRVDVSVFSKRLAEANE